MTVINLMQLYSQFILFVLEITDRVGIPANNLLFSKSYCQQHFATTELSHLTDPMGISTF